MARTAHGAPLHVTFLSGEYPPLQGGIADHTAALAHHLSDLGVTSSILTSRRWQRETPLAPQPSGDTNTLPAVWPILPNWGWRCWPAIATFLKEQQPDILHIQYQAAAFDLGGWVNWLPWYLIKRQAPGKVVTTFHDLRLPYIFPKAGSFRWKSMLALARHSHAVICTNREDLEQLSRNNEQLTIHSTGHLPTSQASQILTHIPLGSNVEPQPAADYNRADWRAALGLAEDDFLLAYFGFLNHSKGGETLIEALALLRRQGVPAHLLLIGGDVGHADPSNIAYARQVQALIERHQLARFVHRTGYVELPEVSAALLAADVVVMPYVDGVSFRRTTLIAALRHGCPVVSTTPPNPALIPEIKPGQNMLLAPPNNPVALAKEVGLLAHNRSLRESLARGATSLGALFEWPNIATATQHLYQHLLNQ